LQIFINSINNFKKYITNNLEINKNEEYGGYNVANIINLLKADHRDTSKHPQNPKSSVFTWKVKKTSLSKKGNEFNF
jgi:hypothetical protein